LKHRGITLVEVICATAIVAILAAISMPIISSAVGRARESTCGSKLQQLHAAILLYRTDCGADGIYGAGDKMGLPRRFGNLLRAGYLTRPALECSGNPAILGGNKAVFMKMFSPPNEDYGHPKWADYAELFREDSILVIDPNHRNENKPMFTQYVTHHLLGVYLDGHIRTKTGKGFWGSRTWWNN
jgi:prepilin-type N-terminal cleavage/methylation domain-containing protein